MRNVYSNKKEMVQNIQDVKVDYFLNFKSGEDLVEYDNYAKQDEYIVSKNGKEVYLNGKKLILMKQYTAGKGYKYVSRHKKLIPIHRLNAKAFIPNPMNKREVNHMDGDKTNNNVDNLEWTTRAENAQHAHDTGLIKMYKYECKNCSTKIGKRSDGLCGNCRKLKHKHDVIQNKIRKRQEEFKNVDINKIDSNKKRNIVNIYLTTGRTYKSIGEEFGVSRQSIEQTIKSALKEGEK